MTVARRLNLAVSFFVELGMLGAFAYWGVEAGSRPWISIVLGITIPVVAALVWGAFLAPRARVKIAEPWHTIAALVLFGVAAAALFVNGHPALAWIYLGIAVVNRAVRVFLRQT